MKLKIIIASTRPGRVGETIGKWFTKIAKKNKSFAVEVIDLADVNLPLLDEPNLPFLQKYTKVHTKEWSEMINDADAFVFVTPEYNYGYPASLKNAIDYLHHEWGYKPMSFVSYGGIAAGTRSVQQLKQVLTPLNMMPISEAVAIPFFTEYMNDKKVFIGNERFEKAAVTMVEKLSIWSQHMKALREEIKSRQ